MKKSTAALSHKKEINILLLVFIFILIITGTLLAWDITCHTRLKPGSKEGQAEQPVSSSLVILRDTKKTLVRPLILADIETESPGYSTLKGQLSQTIRNFEQKGVITDASVYLKKLNDGSWMNINANETYLPGSLMKVAIMLYYLKQEELHAGTLGNEFYCEKPHQDFPKQEFEGKSIVSGKRYKISELIQSMIVESDNLATNVLCQHLNANAYHQMFIDLGIPPDDINDLAYEISPKEFSKFLRVLYNASYVNEQLSEYGLALMTQSKFKEGLVKQLPSDLLIARKFGERGLNNVMDFSESGIVYDNKEPYLLTIMTRGSNMKEQAGVISEISDEVFISLTKE